MFGFLTILIYPSIYSPIRMILNREVFCSKKMVPTPISFFQIDNTLPDSNVLHNGRGEGEAQTGIFKALLNSLSGKLRGSDHGFKRSLNLISMSGFHCHCLVCTFFYINVIVVVILQSLILHGLSH